MPLRNTDTTFGWLSRLIHWLMAVGLIAMLVFGTVLKTMEPSFANLWMYDAHKSFGLLLFMLVLLRIIWHRLSPPPAPLSGVPLWQERAARWAHRTLYALMILVPLSGWIGSAATGISVRFFGLRLPQVVPPSAALDTAGFAAHSLLTKLLTAVILLHVLGALHRGFVSRDNSLRRITRGA
jgi:cytochrome b561